MRTFIFRSCICEVGTTFYFQPVVDLGENPLSEVYAVTVLVERLIELGW